MLHFITQFYLGCRIHQANVAILWARRPAQLTEPGRASPCPPASSPRWGYDPALRPVQHRVLFCPRALPRRRRPRPTHPPRSGDPLRCSVAMEKSAAALLDAVAQSARRVNLGFDPRDKPNHRMAERALSVPGPIFQVIDIQNGAVFFHGTRSTPAQISVTDVISSV